MRNYLVKTRVRGLPRADGSRDPVEIGAVIALPIERAVELRCLGAIEETDAPVTIELDWTGAARPARPDQLSTAPISVVAVTDRHALVAAIEDLGGVVFFPGEGLPDDAVLVLADFSNDQLRAEIEARIAEGRVSPVVPMFLGVDEGSPDGDSHAETEIASPAAETTQSGQEGAGGADSGTPPVSEPAPPTAKPAKPARKAKASGQ